MRIYFAGSIRGGREDADLYLALIKYLKKYGIVVTEHVGDLKITEEGEDSDPKYIYDRDIDLLLSSNIVIAEVTTPSHGVGYELRLAVEHKKRVLCLYRYKPDKSLSALIQGNPSLHVCQYTTPDEAYDIIDGFVKDSL